MPDAAFDDAYLASLYDALNYGDEHGNIGGLDAPDDQFYLDLARDAAAVLDIGCGTGALLHELRPGGTLAFETRNRDVRTRQTWTPERARTVRDPAGRTLRVHHEVLDVDENEDATLVSFAEIFDVLETGQVLSSRTTLRFPTPVHLDELLAAAGFVVAARYGDWDRSPLTTASPEIITLATAV